MRETHVWNYGDYPRATSNKYSRLRNVEKRDYLGSYVYFLLRNEGRPSLYKLDLISKKKELVVDSVVDDFRIEGLDVEILGEKNISLSAYNIEDNNFFKLRDLAAIFSASEKGFEVTWNEDKKSIELISGQTYTSVGSEFEKPRAKDIRAVKNKAKIYKDGRELELEAYNIAGNNYFKLRDITELFNIGTAWDGTSNSIIMDSSLDYIN